MKVLFLGVFAVLAFAGCADDVDVDQGSPAVSVAPNCGAQASWDDVEQVCALGVGGPATDIVVPAEGACASGQTSTADGCVVQHCHAGFVVFLGRCTQIGQIVRDNRTSPPTSCAVTSDGGCH